MVEVGCMGCAPANPFRTYQDREDLAYAELADHLGISIEYAKKLVNGAIGHVEISRAWEFDRITGGELAFDDLIAWGAANGHAPSQAVLERLRRGCSHRPETAAGAAR